MTTKLSLSTMFGVLGPLNRMSYHVNSVGALAGPKDEDHDSCTPLR